MHQTDLVQSIQHRATSGSRLIVAIAGAPASGKSTLADTLAHDLGDTAIVLPMDGFHLDNQVLDDRGLRDTKGAPNTFDVGGLDAMLARINQEDEIAIPEFDRSRDIAIAGRRMVEPHHQIILVEGNYLLFDADPWAKLASHWDLTIMLEVPLDVLETRLIQRWHDYDFDPDQARARALSNDIPNAKTVVTGSRPAQIAVTSS